MRVIRERIDGDTIVNEDTELHGMVVGDTRVCENIVFKLHGTVVGKLILEMNSFVYLLGTVNGDVVNRGGVLEIFGTVNGKVLREGGETRIDTNAVIRDGVF